MQTEQPYQIASSDPGPFSTFPLLGLVPINAAFLYWTMYDSKKNVPPKDLLYRSVPMPEQICPFQNKKQSNSKHCASLVILVARFISLITKTRGPAFLLVHDQVQQSTGSVPLKDVQLRERKSGKLNKRGKNYGREGGRERESESTDVGLGQ